jgi:imidazole glycerol-phosphate synthase subunit HisF
LPFSRLPIPRVIPALLVDKDGMVKTVRYKDPDYLGDPINIINLFNRFEVDEIALLDIGATREDRPPPFELIERLASECWVPLSYGGGIRSFEDARTILNIGVEKVVLGTIAADDPRLITRAAAAFGNQAVIVSIDAHVTSDGTFGVFVESGTRAVGMNPVAAARRAEDLGAGEILLNAIDRDGTMEGYDLKLIRSVTSAVRIPVIASGGAGERADLARPIREAGAAAVAAGSLFVYQGRERGVLVNYPARDQLERLMVAT